jgi:hypothetical protein
VVIKTFFRKHISMSDSFAFPRFNMTFLHKNNIAFPHKNIDFSAIFISAKLKFDISILLILIIRSIFWSKISFSIYLNQQDLSLKNEDVLELTHLFVLNLFIILISWLRYFLKFVINDKKMSRLGWSWS